MLRFCRFIPQHTRRDGAPGGVDLNDLWLFTVALVWGGNAVAGKFLLQQLDPLVVFLVRAVGVAAVLSFAVIVLRRRALWPPRRLLGGYLLAGLLLGLQNLTFFWGMRLTTASEATLLVSTIPLWTVSLIAVCGIERLVARNWAGAALALAGIALVVFGAAEPDLDYAPNRLLGNLIMVVSAGLFAGYMVLVKGWMEEYGAGRVLASGFAVSLLVALPVGLGPALGTDWAALTSLHWTALGYTVFIAGGYGFLVWYKVVRRTSAARTALYQYLVPVVAVILAWLLLGEQLTPWQIAGLGLTLVGIYLARPLPTTPQACPGQASCP